MTKIIKISALAALVTSSLVGADIDAKLSEMEAKINALQTQLNQSNKTLSEVKAHDGNDNLKFGVDFRTAIDSIHYTHANGSKTSNPDLMTNRLWLNMGYSPDDSTIFKGKLSYMKAYGDSANHSQANVNPGFANFDWVTNENATDNTLKVKEAYWLYKQDTLAGANIPWTMSIGRRPSTDGLGINLREGQKEASPLAHTVNVEFDGLSSKLDLDKVTGIPGMSWKLCTGRGMTNAKPRFDMMAQGADYSADNTKTHDINMYGFIFEPFNNGQYSVSTNWARAENLIGFNQSTLQTFEIAYGAYMQDKTATKLATMIAAEPTFASVGDLDLLTAIVKAEGIGSGISDFLDNTTVFASWAQSTTRPKGSMLGSTESKTGSSVWLGANIPCPLTKDGRIGIEWNKGSKYWRGITYGEDTLAGSKLAARGTAVEVYYNKPITKSLSWDLRYTDIKYDYTGSNNFFGDDGSPYTMADAILGGHNPVEKATDLRASVSYRF